jgi:hypothetical protein
MKELTLAEFSFTATINAPIEKIDLPAWIFWLAFDQSLKQVICVMSLDFSRLRIEAYV